MSTPLMTRRTYLTMRAMEQGASMLAAMEAVASVALAHPEWDMDEVRSMWQWAADESGAAS
jgi:hypothetical protein